MYCQNWMSRLIKCCRIISLPNFSPYPISSQIYLQIHTEIEVFPLRFTSVKKRTINQNIHFFDYLIHLMSIAIYASAYDANDARIWKKAKARGWSAWRRARGGNEVVVLSKQRQIIYRCHWYIAGNIKLLFGWGVQSRGMEERSVNK